MEEEIKRALAEIEAREHIRILLAVAVGSQAWGVAAPNSDYDIRFLYCRTAEEYLRLKSLPEVIEERREEMDIEGRDLRKALKLLREGNPSLYEWFSSPIRYRNTPEAAAIRALQPKYFDPRKILHCYLGMGDRVHKSFLKDEMVPVKRYLHVIWCVLICRWTLDKGSPPPLLYEKLVPAVLDPELVPTVRDLIQRRRNILSQGSVPRIASLDRYLDDQLSAISREGREKTWRKMEKIPWETLDELFLQIVLGETQ